MSLLIERLRDMRESKGLSQRELARTCGLGENQIHRYETGKSDPSATHLKAIADKLEVSTDYLLGLTDEPQGHLVLGDLDSNELEVVTTYRRDGWLGVIRLSTDRLSK